MKRRPIDVERLAREAAKEVEEWCEPGKMTKAQQVEFLAEVIDILTSSLEAAREEANSD